MGKCFRAANHRSCAWRCRPESNRRGIDGNEQVRAYFLKTFAIMGPASASSMTGTVWSSKTSAIPAADS